MRHILRSKLYHLPRASPPQIGDGFVPLVHDRPNVTLYETICRIIEPSVSLLKDGPTYWYVDSDAVQTSGWPTQQQAWKEMFQLLDRRKATEDRRVEA